MRFASACWANAHPWDKFINFPCVEVNYPEELREGDVLIIHGGADISPSLYKQKVSKAYASEKPSSRDLTEWNLIQKASAMGLPIIGICRGAQMLCAAAGGTLVQHVNGHGGNHNITTSEGETISVNSIHHQMMNPTGTKHELWAWAAPARSEVYHGETGPIHMDQEPELIYFPELKGFAVQWHPEMMGHHVPATRYLMKKMHEVFKWK